MINLQYIKFHSFMNIGTDEMAEISSNVKIM